MPARRTCTALALIGALLSAGTVGACGDDTGVDRGGDDRLAVAAAFYPLQYVAEQVGGDAVTVHALAKPGAEPHDLELTLGEAAAVAEADLVVYLRGFQPAVDDVVADRANDRAFDAASVQPLLESSAGGHEHDGEDDPDAQAGADTDDKDPHLWLDPTRLAAVGDRLAERLTAIDGARAADYTAGALALRTALQQVDREYAAGLKTCQRREIVTSHAAFGYLAERYDLEQIAITGLTPESEPSPQRLADVIREAREHGATTIFFETLVSPAVAEAIAREVGAATAVLDPIEGLRGGTDYLAVMRTNLATLRSALGCS